MPSGFAPLPKLDVATGIPQAPLPVAHPPSQPVSAEVAAAAAVGLAAGRAAAMQAAQAQQDPAAMPQQPPQQGFMPYKWRHRAMPAGTAGAAAGCALQPPSLLQLGKRSASDSLALDHPHKRSHLGGLP